MRKPRLDTELSLIARLQAGDADAVSELAETHGGRIFQLAFRCLHNHEDAQELTQDVLLIVWRRIRAFRCDSALSSWIHRITFNAAMSRLRRSRRYRQIERTGLGRWPLDLGDSERPAAEPIDWSPAADDVLMHGEMRARLHQAMRYIPPAFRRCLVLRDLEGLSTREASQVLRLKPQTVKSRIHRGRRLLRQRLAILDGVPPQPPYTERLAPPGGGPLC